MYSSHGHSKTSGQQGPSQFKEKTPLSFKKQEAASQKFIIHIEW